MDHTHVLGNESDFMTLEAKFVGMLDTLDAHRVGVRQVSSVGTKLCNHLDEFDVAHWDEELYLYKTFKYISNLSLATHSKSNAITTM